MNYSVKFDLDFKRNEYSGKFIVIEGIDGSGKSTQVEKVAQALKEQGKQVHPTKEPTDGPIGQFIRKVLSGEVVVPPASIQYLIASDRAMHQVEIIEQMKKGMTVISDRYFWSAIAYGMADKNGLNQNSDLLLVSQSMLSMYNQFILPNKTFYLETSVDTAFRRLSGMDKTKEIYEKREKLEKISKGYDFLLNKFPEEFIVIDGEKREQEITDQIVSSIKY